MRVATTGNQDTMKASETITGPLFDVASAEFELTQGLRALQPIAIAVSGGVGFDCEDSNPVPPTGPPRSGSPTSGSPGLSLPPTGPPRSGSLGAGPPRLGPV